MLTFASTTKTSTGRSILASIQPCLRIHQRMYSSPGFPSIPSGKTIPMRPPGLSQSTAPLDEQHLGGDGSLIAVTPSEIRRFPRSQACAPTRSARRMFGSVIGISDPKGGFVITTSMLPSGIQRTRSSRPARCPRGTRANPY